MSNYQTLNEVLRINQKQYPEEFQTTDFWEYAAGKLKKALSDNAIRDFRNNSDCLSFFVPTYGTPGNGLTPELIQPIEDFFKESSPKQKNQINNLMKGYESAKADHRLIMALENALGLDAFQGFTESSCGNPKEQFTFGSRIISRASQNYILGLLFYYINVKEFNFKSVVEIGGGFGSLGEILGKSSIPIKNYINFDIPPTCLFADYYLSQSLSSKYTKLTAEPWKTNTEASRLEGFFARPNYDCLNLHGKIDLVVNYHSFQEMEPHVVKAYIDKINEWEATYILLRNIREGKQLKTESAAGVVTPIKTDDYLSWLQNYELIDTSSLVFGNVTADNFHSELMLLKRR